MTPTPIPIPRDLKPGDVIVDANNERHTCRRVDGDSCYNSINGSLWTAIDDNVSFGRWFRTNGRPYGQRAFAVRIERIASKARKAMSDKDIRWLLRLACAMNTQGAKSECKRLRAIARRLDGGGK